MKLLQSDHRVAALSLQDKAEGWAGMAGGKLGSAAGRAGERAVPGQWKDRGELVRAAVNARAWIAVRRSTERTAADMAMRQKLVVAKEGCQLGRC